MNQTLLVDRREPCGGFARDLAKLICRVATLGFSSTYVAMKGLARYVFHYEHRTERARRQVVHPTHIRMTNGTR